MRQLRALALSDELTGLLNRRELQNLLQNEWLRAVRFKRPFALGLADIDHFKRVNDDLRPSGGRPRHPARGTGARDDASAAGSRGAFRRRGVRDPDARDGPSRGRHCDGARPGRRWRSRPARCPNRDATWPSRSASGSLSRSRTPTASRADRGRGPAALRGQARRARPRLPRRLRHMPARATLLGVPWDGSSSFQRGAADAPDAIRAALWSASSNTWNESGDDSRARDVLDDAGNLDAAGGCRRGARGITAGVAAPPDRRAAARWCSAAITPSPIRSCRAWAGRGPPLTVLHFDAHGDMYDDFEGDRYSHACPFARVMEEGLAARLIQVGVRALTAHLRAQAERFGVEVYGPAAGATPSGRCGAPPGRSTSRSTSTCSSRCWRPGVSHPEPGGLTVREVLEVLAAVRAPVVGADIVEYNPRNDLRDLTAQWRRSSSRNSSACSGKRRAGNRESATGKPGAGSRNLEPAAGNRQSRRADPGLPRHSGRAQLPISSSL